MSAVTYQSEDILKEIDTKVLTEAPVLSAEQVASPAGCITLLGVIEICYQVAHNAIDITVYLTTPIGKILIGHIHLDPQHPSVTIGGGVDGFKAEVTATFDFGTHVLKLCGKACAPFVGCKSGCTEIHL
jgi:hypothetical protein